MTGGIFIVLSIFLMLIFLIGSSLVVIDTMYQGNSFDEKFRNAMKMNVGDKND